ncbi:MAG TPA: GMC family oxidoreductase [Bryobacteraceae bacterium]|nr:GMC family oxidoreductase [Bryobacteraceae bacterium]
MKSGRVDAIVVGAGASGGIVAKELACAGWTVALLERGPWLKTFGHRETRDSWTTAIETPPFGPDPVEVRTTRPSSRDPSTVVKPRTGLYGTLPAMVGGGSVFYGAMAWRFRPETFRLRSLLGDVPGANLADWPVSYDDLEPFYEKAEYELGVSGEENPYGPPRRKPLPLPPLPDNMEAAVLYPAALRLGWKPFHTPLAILSQPYRGRAACVRCAFCNGFGCEAGAKSSTLVTVIPEAVRTGLCRVIPDSFVREITVNAQGRPDGVLYQTSGSKSWRRLSARVIVVCASATETPRLLLNSKSRFFPSGIGNRHDQVGRNIENDGGLFAYGLFDRVVTDLLGPGVCFAVDDFQFRDPAAGRLAGIISNYHTRPPLAFVRRIQLPDSVPPYGSGLRDFYRHYFLRSIWLYATCHTLPRGENRVDTDPEVRDARGVPVSRITYRQHPRNAEQEQFMADRCADLLHEAGAKTVVPPRVVPKSASGISTHQLGSCRMGTDPASSVTDRMGRVHGIQNVYIADGSLLVNPGGFNPSLTIQALAYWVSAGILRDAKT